MRGDRTIELIRQGYPWAARLRDGAVAVPTRLLGRRAAVVGGPEGVRRFYDPRLTRRRAFPMAIQLVLFGPGTVHGLDDAEHHHQKAMFLEVLTPDAVAALGRRAEQEWETAVRRWAGRDRVVLFDEAVHVLAASVLPWAGVPVTPEELPRLARRLAAVLDGFATPGPAYLRAVVARRQVGRWAGRLVRRVRSGELHPPPGSALQAAAALRHVDGRVLPERAAGVTLLNVVRPTVAVAWFVAFAGKALHEHPEWRRRIADGDEVALAAFVQEVRRLYPSCPSWPPAPGRHRTCSASLFRVAASWFWTSTAPTTTRPTGRTRTGSTRTVSCRIRSISTPSSRKAVATSRRGTAVPARRSRSRCWRSPRGCSPGRLTPFRPRTWATTSPASRPARAAA